MLVERHVSLLSFGRSLAPPYATPLRLSFKKYRRSGRAVRQRGGLWRKGRENASKTMNFAQKPVHRRSTSVQLWERKLFITVFGSKGATE